MFYDKGSQQLKIYYFRFNCVKLLIEIPQKYNKLFIYITKYYYFKKFVT